MAISYSFSPGDLLEDAIQDFEIDWGTGTNQVDANDIPYDGVQSVKQKIDSIVAGATATVFNTYTAGENLTSGDVVYMKSDGKVYKAQADVEAESEFYGVAQSTVLAAAPVDITLLGLEDSFAGLVAGTVYYLSEIAGQVTAVAPFTSGARRIRIGTAESTSIMNINPQIIGVNA